jgi:hypothetical protein
MLGISAPWKALAGERIVCRSCATRLELTRKASALKQVATVASIAIAFASVSVVFFADSVIVPIFVFILGETVFAAFMYLTVFRWARA